MSDVPSDVLREILLRLPADSLWSFRNVCRRWRRIIDDPSFVRSHSTNLHRFNSSTLLIKDAIRGCLYSLSFETLNLAKDGNQTIEVDSIKQLITRGVPRAFSLPISVCNGLILIAYYKAHLERNWVVWNPLTRDFLKLPIPGSEFLTPGFGLLEILSGSLGYDHSTDDYKVVRIDFLECRENSELRTLVYSLKLGFWRRLGKNLGLDINPIFFNKQKGVFFNGALYWTYMNEIIRFDLGTEDYTKVKGPPISVRPFSEYLEVLGESLVFSCYIDNKRTFKGWIMRANGEWIELFSVRRPTLGLKPVAYFKEKKLVILQEFIGQVPREIFCFDLESKTLSNVIIEYMRFASCMQFFPGSLFRLNDRGGAAAAAVNDRRGRAAAGVKRKRSHHERLTIELNRIPG